MMVYPEIDLPMYEPLDDMSSEYLVPNIQLLEVNSITLLETNQKFIEAYMVGLNHEFARELLWREYPTDQRGSYFRQFWDVAGFLAEPGADPAAQRERLRDIPELHTWSPGTGLGEHDHREEQGDKEEEVVLAIRGELLKKYPTAVIYAHRAAWERTSGGAIDKSKPRKLADLARRQAARATWSRRRSTRRRWHPDIYFFGFDLTAETAKGGQDVGGEEDPGWFFVIKERPGEPRFGLDLPQAAPQGADQHVERARLDRRGRRLRRRASAAGRPAQRRRWTTPAPGPPRSSSTRRTRRFRWRADTHAAELAYILYQVPVLMAVHAAEMLQKDG